MNQFIWNILTERNVPSGRRSEALLRDVMYKGAFWENLFTVLTIIWNPLPGWFVSKFHFDSRQLAATWGTQGKLGVWNDIGGSSLKIGERITILLRINWRRVRCIIVWMSLVWGLCILNSRRDLGRGSDFQFDKWVRRLVWLELLGMRWRGRERNKSFGSFHHY